MKQNNKPDLAEELFPQGVSYAIWGGNTALISTTVHTRDSRPVGLRWEVFEHGGVDPIRFGLSLATAEQGFRVQVPVLGLSPGRRYSFRFVTESCVSVAGELQIQAENSSRPSLAA